MENDLHQEIAELRRAPGELSFEARIGGRAQRVWFRTEKDLVPAWDAALAACLMPAMRSGGTLAVPEPLSAKLLRNQQEFQAIQHAWSLDWAVGDPPLREVTVLAPSRPPQVPEPNGRVAAFFSAGVDSWSTVLEHPELTDLIFVRGVDLLPHAPHQADLVDEVEGRVRWAAQQIGLQLHVVETNLRELSDPLVRWEAYYGCAVAAVALLFEPLFERVLIAGDSDYEIQAAIGASRLVDQLFSTEQLEVVDDGGRHSRIERTARIAGHPIVQQTLRVCWENRDGAYNCGRCRKCLMTMLTLEALGVRDDIATFPSQLDLDAVAAIEINQRVLLTLWEDVLDATRAADRADLEQTVEVVVARAKRRLGLASHYRRRALPGPPPTVRIAAIVPVWRQSQYMAAAVQSVLDQEIATGVGVVIVNDGCPQPETDRIARLLHDADPERVAYLRQPNRGVSAARNAGIRRAFARWPHLEAIFPLDADNVLSPQTLAELWTVLEERPEIAWASPALEFFGAEEGVWSMPEPFLAYRQLFTNQSDVGSLIRRSVFQAGIAFDETMGQGFEDWEFFLRATLAGFRGGQAGSCGFRYRRRPDSLLSQAQDNSEALETELRDRHGAAYAPGALARREHAEAPRFGLVRCDADDVLLTAACDLEPHRVPLADFLRPRDKREVSPLQAHAPAIAVLTTTETVDWLSGKQLLAETLLQLQMRVRQHAIVGLRLARRPSVLPRPRQREAAEPPGFAALALRTRTLAKLAPAGIPMPPEEVLAVDTGRGRLPKPLSESLVASATDRMRLALRPGKPLVPDGSHAEYFEYRHVDLLDTTLPSSRAEDEPGAILQG